MKITIAVLAITALSALLARPSSENDTRMRPEQKIKTFLWFDDDAEEAVNFYVSLIPNSKVLSTSRWGDGGPVPKGTLMSARFELGGVEFMALNGGPVYRFNEAISLFVACESQGEIDDLWDRLTSSSGEKGRCGWLKDRFGLSWQIVPSTLGAMLGDPDPAKARRVGAAMMGMDKLDLAALRRAHEGN